MFVSNYYDCAWQIDSHHHESLASRGMIARYSTSTKMVCVASCSIVCCVSGGPSTRRNRFDTGGAAGIAFLAGIAAALQLKIPAEP
jgi:hypothetical protein